MPAQPGGNVLLDYGNQGVQQIGNAAVLSYDAPATTGSVPIGLSTLSPWKKSRTTMRALNARYDAITKFDSARKAPWVAAETTRTNRDSGWRAIAKRDDVTDTPWGAFGEMANEDKVVRWALSAPFDDNRVSAWSAYGEMLNEDRGGKWAGSKATDAARRGVFGSFWIPTYIPIPYLRPDGLVANFFVVGGSPIPAWTMPSTEANQYLPIEAQFGAGLYTPHFTGDPLRTYWPPAPSRANFLIDENASRQLLVDEFGVPILTGANRDTFKYNPWGVSKRVDDTTIIPWIKYSRPMNPGWGVVTPGGPTVPTPGETITIPVKAVYIVVNEILLLRADDNTPIYSTALNIAFDCDSWLPTFSATIPETSRDAVMPDPNPVEIYAYINGSEFRFFVEKVARSRQFGSRSVSISGRALACELDAPFAAASQHTNTIGATAQQIIDNALAYSTYTQTWNITDWLVPANTFSMFGTPAAVAAEVAAASGSVLQADWAIRDLRMLPRYPVKPWDWATATPEYVIPAAIAQTESIEWIEKPDYNVVYVSGVQNGVLGQVKITGTAGDKPAPMVTNQLITHIDAARQRGIAILGDTGRKAMMQISMPVLAETGVIDVCRLIEFSDGANTRRGIVRANNVSVNWPTVRQTLTVEAAV